MKAIGVIPARFGSTRLEGKVLVNIAGKPMIQHVWERSKKSQFLDRLLIACDDQRILDAAQAFGAEAVLTSVEHPTGTDRITEVVEKLDVDLVVNIQGDEPLIHHSIIDNLIQALEEDVECPMATVVCSIEHVGDHDNPNVVKAAFDQEHYAEGFSRSKETLLKNGCQGKILKHLGIYAYRRDFLLKFSDLPPSENEKKEKLEQLRVLDAGYKIKIVETSIETIGVDTPEDLAKVESMLG